MPYNYKVSRQVESMKIYLSGSMVNAEDRLGAGTAMEFVNSKYLKKPVITVLPKDTYHMRSNIAFNGRNVADWTHPFVRTFSDFIPERIEDVGQIKDAVFSAAIKDITVIDKAIAYREADLRKVALHDKKK